NAQLSQFLTEQQMIKSGQELFVRNCSGCHGIDARGAGPAAAMLDPRPRNLVEGSFKLRSTPTGMLPTKEDLLRTISQGIPNSSMPAFRHMSSSQKMAIVVYIQFLREDWKENQGSPILISEPPSEIFSKKETLL